MNTLPQPSIKSLIVACISSTLLAIVILLVAVLPAEFNIDPTGLGKSLGLTVLAATVDEQKLSVVTCPEVIDKNSPVLQWQDSILITVPAKKGLEYKFYIVKGEKIEFIWETNGEKLYFDFHGEPEGDKTGYFKSYKESTQSKSSGSLTAPFTGSHGWYWENKTNQSITIILKTRGNYKMMGLR
ncbi:MAG: hypothetical protein KAT04_03040 [Methylococcales bacterium]|nr:hypothetical protein [Methylococcales bacterium]